MKKPPYCLHLLAIVLATAILSWYAAPFVHATSTGTSQTSDQEAAIANETPVNTNSNLPVAEASTEVAKPNNSEQATAASDVAKTPICGDGTTDAEEQCDDGNQDAADGCNASCQTESASIALDVHSATDLIDTQTIAHSNVATFEIIVANTGETRLTNVIVASESAPLCNQNFEEMAPDGKETYICSTENIIESFKNTVTATAVSPSQEETLTAVDSTIVVVERANETEAAAVENTTTRAPAGAADDLAERAKEIQEDISGEYREGEVLVKYKDRGELVAKISRSPQQLGGDKKLTIEREVTDLKVAVVRSEDESATTEELIAALEDKDTIVEPNYRRELTYIPNDGLFSQQWGLHNTGQTINGSSSTVDVDVDMPEAWDIEANGNDVIVAVLDTGVEHNHSDLSANMWSPTSCVDHNGAAISGGCPNHGWDYLSADNNPDDTSDFSSYGHGTFSASVIAAKTNNSSGMAGMSRHNNVKIMALRFGFDIASEINAINFAARNGAKVINASFGGEGFSQIEKNAIDAFPGVFVTAAGNGGNDFIGDNIDTSPFYPCAYTSSNLICTAASNQQGNLASFSNYGTTSVDIAAPGVNILGVYRGSYTFGNGTSFATPHVAGAAALVYGEDTTQSRFVVRSRVLENASSWSSFNGRVFGNRSLNVQQVAKDYASIVAATGLTPIYRLYNTRTGVHLYTRGVADRDKILNKFSDFEFTDGGPAFYATLNP